jgi:hypothetical protein
MDWTDRAMCGNQMLLGSSIETLEVRVGGLDSGLTERIQEEGVDGTEQVKCLSQQKMEAQSRFPTLTRSDRRIQPVLDGIV